MPGPYIENSVYAVKLAKGINTKKNVTVGGSANFDASGSTGTFKTSTGATTIGGATTFNSSVTFTSAPTGPRTSNVVDMTSATVSPTASQSGSTFLFDRAAGVTVTLPTPVAGIAYRFIVVTTVTSNSYKIITNAGTTFVTGSILASSDNLASKSFIGDGATHVAITQAAASSNATGGIIGSVLDLVCVTSTLWEAYGSIVASATPTTPWATS